MRRQVVQADPSGWSHDVAVIGGGPAGATAGALLARRGRRVLILERERFPRFHIGESLLPSTNAIFAEMGISPADLAAASVEKWGASFQTDDGLQCCRAEFARGTEVEAPRTFQVLRSRFDELLLERAAAHGAEVRQETRALEARFDRAGVTLSFRGPDGETRETRAGCLVDASGRAGFLATRLRLRRPDPDLRKVAIYAHYRGIARPAGRIGGDIRIISRRDMGWVWLIPLADDLTSVGVVVDHRMHAARRADTAEEALDAYLRETPVLAPLLRQVERVGPAHVEADFAYEARSHSGERWLMVGDAGAFLDPVFSSGVYLAMASGRDAAEVLDGALRDGDLSARRLRRHDRAVQRRYRRFRRFAAGFYRPEFRDLFFQPTSRFSLFEAVVTGLAGNSEPGLRTRAAINSFFGLVRVQRWLSLVPRRHAAAGRTRDGIRFDGRRTVDELSRDHAQSDQAPHCG